MTAGMILVAVQLVLFSRLGADATFWNLLPALLIGGVGMALTMTPSAAAATRSVPVDKAGVGSAVLNSARQVGGTMGIAIMGAIMAHGAGGEVSRRRVHARLRARAPSRRRDRRRRRGRGLHPRPPTRRAGERVGTAPEPVTSEPIERARNAEGSLGRRPTACARRRGKGAGGKRRFPPPRTENAPGCGSGGRFPFEATPSRGGEPVNRGSAAQPRSSCARLLSGGGARASDLASDRLRCGPDYRSLVFGKSSSQVK